MVVIEVFDMTYRKDYPDDYVPVGCSWIPGGYGRWGSTESAIGKLREKLSCL